jgi:hypothetical protein
VTALIAPSQRIAAVALTLASAGLVAAPGAAASDTTKRSACERMRGEDLAPARTLKVVRREYRDGAVRIFACAFPRGRVQMLTRYVPEGDFDSGDIRVTDSTSRHVLVRWSWRDRGNARGVTRFTARTRARRDIVKESCDPFGACTGQYADAAVLHPTGAVAAVVHHHPPCCLGAAPATPPPHVLRVDPFGRRTVLEEGPGMTGLRADGDGFTWLRDGEPRRAPATPG